MTQCPLCERPARFERTREFPAPRRHYRCVCAEFIVDDSGARKIATAGEVNNRGLVESATALTTETHVCCFEMERSGGQEIVTISTVSRADALR